MEIMIQKAFRVIMFAAVVLIAASSCNHNKIACPTYADSFPDAKKSKKPDGPPPLPPASKTKISHSMNPGGN
jgi:hypothetical protein